MKDIHKLKAYSYIEDGVFKGNKAPFILRILAVFDKLYYHIIMGNKIFI